MHLNIALVTAQEAFIRIEVETVLPAVDIGAQTIETHIIIVK